MVMNAEIFKRELLPHHQLLYRIAYRLLEDSFVAEDMVQEAYTKLWDKRNEIASIENHRAFAIATLRNLCIDYLRKRRERVSFDDKLESFNSSSLSTEIELKDDVRYLESLIEKLPDQQRKIMILKHWDHYSDDEIEQITGLSKGNIRVVLSRARNTIKEQFKKLR